MNKDRTSGTTLYLPISVLDELERRAKDEDKSRSALMREVLIQYLEADDD